MKIVITGFADTMTKPQRAAGYIYLPLYMIVLPLFVVMLAALSPEDYNDVTANAVYYGIGLVFCLIPMRKYLRSAYDALLDKCVKARNFHILLFNDFLSLFFSRT